MADQQRLYRLCPAANSDSTSGTVLDAQSVERPGRAETFKLAYSQSGKGIAGSIAVTVADGPPPPSSVHRAGWRGLSLDIADSAEDGR